MSHVHPNYSKDYKKTTWVNKNTWDAFETTFSEALNFQKPLYATCVKYDDDVYDNDYLNYNEEVYDFTTSYIYISCL